MAELEPTPGPGPGPAPSLQVLIDRAVEGGLPPALLREVVRRLDAEPDGWRRCALAFLEAQAWGEELRGLGDEAFESPPLPAAGPALRPRHRLLRLATAAAIGLASFSLGWAARRTTSVGGHADAPAAAAPSPRVAHVETREAPEPSGAAQPPPAVREVARLRVSSAHGGAATPAVPILEGAGLGPRWLAEAPLPVSEQHRALWRRQGYEVDQRRRVVSVPLADGRRAAVPVDQVRLRYVGREPL